MADKDYSLSLIRLLGTIFVIFCHVCEQYGRNYSQTGFLVFGNYLSVGVQMFLLLSGYLYSRKVFLSPVDRIQFVIKNFIKILTDYYICVIFFLIPAYYFFAPEYLSLGSIANVLSCRKAWWGIHHLWYIPYCLFCYLLTPVLYDIKAYYGDKRSILLLVIGLFMTAELLLRTYIPYFMPCWIVCYCIGYFLPSLLHSKCGGGYVIFMITCILNVLRYYYRYVWDDAEMSMLANFVLDFLSWYACVFLGLSIFLAILRLTRGCQLWGKFIIRVLEASDIYSYDVYLVHMIFVKGCLTLIGRLGGFAADSVAVLLISVIMGIVLNQVSVKVKNLLNKRLISA